MKKIEALAIIVAFVLAILYLISTHPVSALTGDTVRFDFINGQPTTVDDTSTTCTGQTTIRYDFTNGMPTGVFDTTATCTAAAAGGTVNLQTIFKVSGGTLIIKGGTTLIKGGN